MDSTAKIRRALNVDASKMGDVQKIFADQWIGTARAGWMIQKADGTWAKK